MRTTVDIPDQLYRQLKARAALDGTSVKEVLLKLVQRDLRPRVRPRRTQFPLIAGREKRRLNVNGRQVDDILFS